MARSSYLEWKVYLKNVNLKKTWEECCLRGARRGDWRGTDTWSQYLFSEEIFLESQEVQYSWILCNNIYFLRIFLGLLGFLDIFEFTKHVCICFCNSTETYLLTFHTIWYLLVVLPLVYFLAQLFIFSKNICLIFAKEISQLEKSVNRSIWHFYA